MEGNFIEKFYFEKCYLLILGISFITGCFIINGSQSSSNETIKSENLHKPLMTIRETADYLNISESQVRAIISYEETMLKSTGSYMGKMFPIIKIGNDIFISTIGINEWLIESSQQTLQD